MLKFRGGLDPIARELLELADDLRLRPRRAQVYEHHLFGAGVAIALEVVLADGLGVGRDRKLDLRTAAPIRLEQFLDSLDLARGFVGTEVEPAPPVAVIRDAPQRGTALAAEEHRQLGPAHRLGIAADALEPHEFAGVAAELVAPQLAHRLDIFTSTLRAAFPRYADRLEFLFAPSDADAQDAAPVAQEIQRRNDFGEHQRVMLRHRAYSRCATDFRGDRRHTCERQERVRYRRGRRRRQLPVLRA